jgi:putative intracellular protease/amidase
MKKRLVVLLFQQYEILDVFGPIEFFAAVPRLTLKEQEGYSIEFIGYPNKGAILSSGNAGNFAHASSSCDEFLLKHQQSRNACDILLVPGGQGTRTLVNDRSFLNKLVDLCDKSKIICSVCTGSALLAKAGILDGKRATSNKMSFAWVKQQSAKVTWQPKARWVEDGKYFTSSGVAAGIDLALALIANDFGTTVADGLAKRLEYIWNKDPNNDPFEAKL